MRKSEGLSVYGVNKTTNFANKAKYGENTTVEKIICDEGQRIVDREIN